MEKKTTLQFEYPKTTDGPKDCQVILQPIAMTIPNSHGVYCPCQLWPQKEMSCEEFLRRYADYPRKIRVCLDKICSAKDLLQKSEFVTAYGFGWDCWYIITKNRGWFISYE